MQLHTVKTNTVEWTGQAACHYNTLKQVINHAIGEGYSHYYVRDNANGTPYEGQEEIRIIDLSKDQLNGR
jgi:hypothetical protein